MKLNNYSIIHIFRSIFAHHPAIFLLIILIFIKNQSLTFILLIFCCITTWINIWIRRMESLCLSSLSYFCIIVLLLVLYLIFLGSTISQGMWWGIFWFDVFMVVQKSKKFLWRVIFSWYYKVCLRWLLGLGSVLLYNLLSFLLNHHRFRLLTQIRTWIIHQSRKSIFLPLLLFLLKIALIRNIRLEFFNIGLFQTTTCNIWWAFKKLLYSFSINDFSDFDFINILWLNLYLNTPLSWLWSSLQKSLNTIPSLFTLSQGSLRLIDQILIC